jgi:hypothetical protein
MATKIKSQTSTPLKTKTKKNNKGVHAVTKTSKNKGSDNYKKPYNKQGRG